MNLKARIKSATETYQDQPIILSYLIQFSELFNRINQLIEKKEQVIIAIDGYSSSGKTTLAQLIGFLFDANIFHMDDFFMPIKAIQSSQKIAYNIDFVRLQNEIINPLVSKKDLSYHCFDCILQSFSDEIMVDYHKVSVIEGAYSMHPNLNENYDMRVFLKISYIKQIKRIISRNGYKKLFDFLTKWIPNEHKYFKELKIIEKADYIYKK